MLECNKFINISNTLIIIELINNRINFSYHVSFSSFPLISSLERKASIIAFPQTAFEIKRHYNGSFQCRYLVAIKQECQLICICSLERTCAVFRRIPQPSCAYRLRSAAMAKGLKKKRVVLSIRLTCRGRRQFPRNACDWQSCRSAAALPCTRSSRTSSSRSGSERAPADSCIPDRFCANKNVSYAICLVYQWSVAVRRERELANLLAGRVSMMARAGQNQFHRLLDLVDVWRGGRWFHARLCETSNASADGNCWSHRL